MENSMITLDSEFSRMCWIRIMLTNRFDLHSCRAITLKVQRSTSNQQVRMFVTRADRSPMRYTNEAAQTSTTLATRECFTVRGVGLNFGGGGGLRLLAALSEGQRLGVGVSRSLLVVHGDVVTGSWLKCNGESS